MDPGRLPVTTSNQGQGHKMIGSIQALGRVRGVDRACGALDVPNSSGIKRQLGPLYG